MHVSGNTRIEAPVRCMFPETPIKLRLSLIVATLVLPGSTWIGVIKLRIKLHPTNRCYSVAPESETSMSTRSSNVNIRVGHRIGSTKAQPTFRPYVYGASRPGLRPVLPGSTAKKLR